MKHLLLCFIAALLLMPSPLMADNAKKKIKTLDITMDMPTADMDLYAGEELALKSAQTAYGDLFKSASFRSRQFLGTESSERTAMKFPHSRQGFHTSPPSC